MRVVYEENDSVDYGWLGEIESECGYSDLDGVADRSRRSDGSQGKPK